MRDFLHGHYIPEEAIVVVVMLIGFAVMFQQKKLVKKLTLLALGAIFTPVILAIFIPEVRASLPMVKEYFMNLGIIEKVSLTLFLFFLVLRLLLPKEVWGNTVGILLADAIKACIKAPFQLVWLLLKGVWYLLATIFGKDRQGLHEKQKQSKKRVYRT